jgi:hypothetical protein
VRQERRVPAARLAGLAARLEGLPARLAVSVAGLVLALSVAACGSTGPSAPATATPDPSTLVSPLDGQVVKLDTEGLTRVRGFVLRTDAGAEVPFVIGILENAVQFPPSHLAEHMATGTAVRAWFHVEDGRASVYRLEDAPTP